MFRSTYLNKQSPVSVQEAHFIQKSGIFAVVTVSVNGQARECSGQGNGRLDAVCNAVKAACGMDFTIETYSEHSLEHGSTSEAAAYVGLRWADGSTTWGAGTDTDIIQAGIKALASAVNNK